MMIFQLVQDSLAQRQCYIHLLGLCLILGTTTLVLNLESLHSYSTGSLTGELRRVLMHDADSPMLHTRGAGDAGPFVSSHLRDLGSSFAHPDLPSSLQMRPSTYKARGRKKLDFFVAGFPKCGTTTMLFLFDTHNETDVSQTEKCVVLNAQVSDTIAINRLDDAIGELTVDPQKKRGIKCPTGIKNSRTLERLHNHSPGTKLIIGVRHPVLFLQSYYNYRVTEIHDNNSKEKIPPLESLIGKTDWKGVSTDMARFDLYLKQLGKTNMTTDQLSEFIGRPHMAVRPNKFKIFFYSLDQMKDKDENRTLNLRKDLQQFLDLKQPLPPFGHENLNNFVGELGHKETVDICEARYDGVRNLLLEQGRMMEEWIRKEFIKSPDVVVANEKHFVETIRTWGTDPCHNHNVTATSRRTQAKKSHKKH